MFLKNRKRSKYTYVRILLAVIGLSALFIIICQISNDLVQQARSIDVTTIDDGWEILVGGVRTEETSISDYKLDHYLGRGETVLMVNKLPEDIGNDYTLQIYTRQSAVRVLINTHEIYSYGMDRYKDNRLVGSGYHFIKLPEGSGGQTIKIILVGTENKAIQNLYGMKIIRTSQAYQYTMLENVISYFIDFFLMIFGLALAIICLFFIQINKDFFQLFLVGCLSEIIGSWSICNVKALQVFTIDISVNTRMEYFLLYLVPIPFLLLYLLVRQDMQGVQRLICRLAFFSCIAFAALAVYEEVDGNVHITQWLGAYHILADAVFVLIIVLEKLRKEKRDLADKLFSSGLIIMMIVGVLEVARYYIRIMYQGYSVVRFSYLSFGMLAFMICAVASYMLRLYRKVLNEKEKHTLAKLAYVDGLTGVYNRKKADEEFVRLDQEKGNYALVNFDLNGLKKLNDTCGHEMGDRLITSFADIIDDVFGKRGNVFRMGGDEFLAICPNLSANEANDLVAAMEKKERSASDQLGFSVSASYGVAFSHEMHNAEAVNRLADSRMYTMKKKTKSGRAS